MKEQDSFCCNPMCQQNQVRGDWVNERGGIEIVSGVFRENRRKIRRMQYMNHETKEMIYFCEICHNAIEMIKRQPYPRRIS